MHYYYLSGTSEQIKNTLYAPLQLASDWYEDARHSEYFSVAEKIAKFIGATLLLLVSLPLAGFGYLYDLAYREAIPEDVYHSETEKWNNIIEGFAGREFLIHQMIKARITKTIYKHIFIEKTSPNRTGGGLFCGDGYGAAFYPKIKEGEPGDCLVIVQPLSRGDCFQVSEIFARSVERFEFNSQETRACTNNIPGNDVLSLNFKKTLLNTHDNENQKEAMKKVHAFVLTSDLDRTSQRQRFIEVLTQTRTV